MVNTKCGWGCVFISLHTSPPSVVVNPISLQQQSADGSSDEMGRGKLEAVDHASSGAVKLVCQSLWHLTFTDAAAVHAAAEAASAAQAAAAGAVAAAVHTVPMTFASFLPTFACRLRPLPMPYSSGLPRWP